MPADAEVKTVAQDKKWALYIGTIYGDLKIRTYDSVTMQADLVAWLSKNNLLAELQDKGPDFPGPGR